MKSALIFSLCLLSTCLNAQSSTQKPAKTDIPQVIHQYFERLSAIFQTGSTLADIDALLAICHQDVRYIHRNYEADFNNQTWKDAFIRNLQAGRYQKPASDCTHISNMIAGKDYYAIEYYYGQKMGATCQPKDDARFLILFKIQDGKIRLIEELW